MKVLPGPGRGSAVAQTHPELLALAVMREEERNDCIDLPELLKHAHAALAALQKKATSGNCQDFLLRQLLHIVALVDVCAKSMRCEVEQLGKEGRTKKRL